MTIDYHLILLQILQSYSDHQKWEDARFRKIKVVSNTKVGEIGQKFVEILCKKIGFNCEFPTNDEGSRSSQSPWDIKIEGMTFELKTATEDISDNFQFNHIRYHRPYQAVLCLGITPNDILFAIWNKEDIATGRAGKLTSMEKGANASYKLTKSHNDLHPINLFEDKLSDFLAKNA